MLTSVLKVKAESAHPGESPSRGLLRDCEIFGNLGLKLYLEPGPQVALQPPQLPHTDHWHASPGNGEQKSQSPLQNYHYLKNHSNNGIAEEFLVDILFYDFLSIHSSLQIGISPNILKFCYIMRPFMKALCHSLKR